MGIQFFGTEEVVREKMLCLPNERNVGLLGDPDLDFLTRLIYNPITGIVYKRRYRMALSLIEPDVGNLLEIGYGAGLLLPSLGLRCKQLYAVDVHEKTSQVEEMLEKEDCCCELSIGSVTSLPFESRFFDLIVCLSVVEHLEHLELFDAMTEMARILRDGGHLILGFPIRNRLTSLLFKAVGFDDLKGHPSDHRAIMARAKSNFVISTIRSFPSFPNLNYSFYTVLKCSA